MKAIPNCITFSRIIFSIVLIFTAPLSVYFFVIYIICGLSDIVDGFVARKAGVTSSFGERLDTVADMAMIGVLLFKLYPVINPGIEIIFWIIAIAIIRLVSMLTARIRFKTFASLHTYGNKITGIILFIFPIMLPYAPATVLMHIICVAASLSAIEEWIIQLTTSELQVNIKSIFVK